MLVLLPSVVLVAIILQTDVHHPVFEMHRRHAELGLLLCRDHRRVSRHPIVTVHLHRASVTEIKYTILPHQILGPIHKWVAKLLRATATVTHVSLQTVLYPATMNILVDHGTLVNLVNLVSQFLLAHRLQPRSPCPLTTAPQQTLSFPPLPVREAALPSGETTHATPLTTARLRTAAAAATTVLPPATRLLK